MNIRTAYKKIEKTLDKFFHSDSYLILMTALSLIGWTFDLGYTVLGIMLSFSIIMFCVSRDTTPFITFYWFFIFAGRTSIFGIEFTLLRIIMIILLCLSVLVNIIRFKPDFKGALGKSTAKGTTFSLFLLIIPMSIGGLFYPVRNINAAIVASVIFVGIAWAYAYFMAMSRKSIVNKDAVMKYMIKLMFLLCLLVSVEMVIHMVREGKDIEGISNLLSRYDFYVYWGGSNHVGAMLALCIPGNFFFMIKNKRTGFLFLILTVVEFCLLIITRSRGSILLATIFVPILLIYSIVRAKNKIPLILTAITTISLAWYFVFNTDNFVLDMINKMLNQGFDDTGRFELWQYGWELFKEYPIFGAGWDFDVTYPDFGLSPMGFHSMIIQVMACSGVVGVLFFTYYYWARYTVFIKRWTDEMIIILAGMLILEGYGMIDHISFLPVTYIIMLLVMAFSVDQSMPDYRGRLLIFKKHWKTAKSI
jgi:O-antigen ligase